VGQGSSPAYDAGARFGRLPPTIVTFGRPQSSTSTMRSHMRSVLTALGLAALAGCSDQGPDAGLREEIERNRDRWVALQPTSYEYEVEVLCFCGVEARGPVTVSVQDGVVVARTYTDTGQPVSSTFEDSFPSVAGLHEILLDAVDGGAFSVDVTWQETTGIPLQFRIDFVENAVDEELEYWVRALPRQP
jgi:hypothetical protein